MCCVAQDTPSPLLRSFPSPDTALSAPECWAEGEEGRESEPKAELAGRNHLRTVRPAAFPSYLCRRHVGRIHDPGLAWGAEHHPGRKGRVTNVRPERGHHPLWKEGQENETCFHSPEGPLVPPQLVVEESLLGFPASWGSRQSMSPQIPTRPNQSISPPLILGLRRAVWVSPGSPCRGRGCRVEALPHHCQLVGTQR